MHFAFPCLTLSRLCAGIGPDLRSADTKRSKANESALPGFGTTEAWCPWIEIPVWLLAGSLAYYGFLSIYDQISAVSPFCH